MNTNWKAVGGLYVQTTPPFFRGVLPDLSRALKASMPDAGVLLVRRKSNNAKNRV